MDWQDYLSIMAIAVTFSIGVYGDYKRHKRKKSGKPNIKPQHYEVFDKRLE